MLPSPRDIEQFLAEQCLQNARQGRSFDGEVVRTVLTEDAATGEQEVFALVSRSGGQCITVGGFEVRLVSAETPAGQALRGCRPGETLLLGRVLAADDSLTRSAEAKHAAEAALSTHAARCREANTEEKRRLAAEREEATQQEQKAFERRAAAHFDRTGDFSRQVKPKNEDAQLKWML